MPSTRDEWTARAAGTPAAAPKRRPKAGNEVTSSADVGLPSIDTDRLSDLAARLVRIPSTSGREGDVARFLATYLGDAGFSVELQEVEGGPGGSSAAGGLASDRSDSREKQDGGRFNVIAVYGRGTPRLLLTGHTDVVPPGTGWTIDPYAGELRDGRLVGRGAADMKGGIASMVEAALMIRASAAAPRGQLMLAFVVGEEVDQSGTRALIERQGNGADYAIVGEPTELRPVVCHKGLLSLSITVGGRAAHASRPNEGVNAIDGMHLFLDRLRPLRAAVSGKAHPLAGTASLIPGTVRGGEVSNMVPAECTLELDRRLLPGEQAGEALAEIEGLARNLRREHPELRFRVEPGLVEAPMEIARDSRIVAELRTATREVRGSDPGASGWSATCDAGLLAARGGIPSVVFGPGSLSQAHRSDEEVEVAELADAARIYSLVASRLLGCTPAYRGPARFDDSGSGVRT